MHFTRATVAALLLALSTPQVQAVPGVSPILKAPRGQKINDEYLLKLDPDGCQGGKGKLTSVISGLAELDADTTREDAKAKVNEVFDKACVLSTTLSAAALQDVRMNENVDMVVEEQYVNGFRVDWHLDRMDSRFKGLDQRLPYTMTGDGTGVDVYVMDSGIDVNHPEFEGRASNFYSVFGDGGVDILGHGTHAAALVGGKTVGIATGSNIYGVKVLNNQGVGTITQILMGLTQIYNWRSRSRPNVISMSLGSESIQIINSMIRRLFDENVLIVTAAGNSGGDACRVSPGKAQETINVGAIDQEDGLAPFSNWGRCIDILAPGVDVRSALPDGRYAVYSGTSVAAPLVAGAAAALWSITPEMSAQEVKQALLLSAGRLKTNNGIGNGRNTPTRLVTTAFNCPWCPTSRVTAAMLFEPGAKQQVACGLFANTCRSGALPSSRLGKWFGDCRSGACTAKLACLERARQLVKSCGNDGSEPAFGVWVYDGTMIKVAAKESYYRFPVSGGRTTAQDWVVYRDMDTSATDLGVGGFASEGRNLEYCKQQCALNSQCNAVAWTGSSCWLKRLRSMDELQPTNAQNRPAVHVIKDQAPVGPKTINGWRVYYDSDVTSDGFLGVGGDEEEGWNLERCQAACSQDGSCNGVSWSGNACWLKNIRSIDAIRPNPDADEQWDMYVKPNAGI